MPPPPGCGVVELPDGDRASGLASMIADLLEANRRDFRLRRWVAGRLRGPVVFTASDRDVSVTLWFDRGAVTVVDGAAVGTPSVAGPWLTMTRVCSGRCSPARAWRDGELALAGPSGRARAAAAAFVLSVPSSFYRPPSADPTVRRLARATLAATLALVAVGGFTRGSGSGYGCEDRWPLCEQGLLGGLLPRPEATMVVEWSHRWLAATVGVLAVVTAVLAWRRRRAPGVVGPAVVAVGVIGAQAWVGRLVVARDLDGDLVALHLAISMVVVALVTVVVMMAGPPPEPAPSGGPGRRWTVALGTMAAVSLGLLLLGASVHNRYFPGWPLMGATAVGGAPRALHLMHRTLAGAGLLGLLALLIAARRGAVPGTERRLLVGATLAYGSNVLVGLAHVLTEVRSSLVVTLHLVLAALVWSQLVAATTHAVRSRSVARGSGAAPFPALTGGGS